MNTEELRKNKNKQYDLASKIANIMYVVSRACFYDEKLAEAELLNEAVGLQYELIDALIEIPYE